MITENLSTLHIHKLNQKQFDRENLANALEENAMYLTPDTSILYIPQQINDEQKLQARINIGAVGINDVEQEIDKLNTRISDTSLIVTVTNNLASHKATQIYELAQQGVNILLSYKDEFWTLQSCQSDRALFMKIDMEDSVFSGIIVDDNNTIESAQEALATITLVDTKITSPFTAKVGQVLAVKSIDENGKPKEWECIDITF